MILLVELRLLALDRVLDEAAEQLLALALQRLDSVDQVRERLGLLLRQPRDAPRRDLLRLAHEVVVVDELVAVVDQQMARAVLDADADRVLRVLAQLADEWREVGVARDQDERVDV